MKSQAELIKQPPLRHGARVCLRRQRKIGAEHFAADFAQPPASLVIQVRFGPGDHVTGSEKTARAFAAAGLQVAGVEVRQNRSRFLSGYTFGSYGQFV